MQIGIVIALRGHELVVLRQRDLDFGGLTRNKLETRRRN
jgi:hypothetical protein